MKNIIRDTQDARLPTRQVIRNTFIFFTFYILHFTFYIPTAYAQEPEEWGDRCQSNGVATLQGFECIFRNIVRILTPLAGLALFIMLILGSFKMMTASGDPKKVQTAQKTLTSAILGLVVFLGIWFILKLIKTITGVDVSKFIIPGPTP